MGKVHEKWRESLIDVNKIDFKDIRFDKIISYPPAGNDVFDCSGVYNNKKIRFIIKSERGKFANFQNEIKILKEIANQLPVPQVLLNGVIDNHIYMVLTKLKGKKLSEIFNDDNVLDKHQYLLNYGTTLAKIHQKNIQWEKAFQRVINDIPTAETYKCFDLWENEIVNYLKQTKPKEINYDTFIHGDFHYGNILWDNYKVTGILDWEYAGFGFKEQDIAWSLILRPGQKFMNKMEHIQAFLEGYREQGSYDIEKLKWCYINGALHFYLMNKKNNDTIYLEQLKSLIHVFLNEEIVF